MEWGSGKSMERGGEVGLKAGEPQGGGCWYPSIEPETKNSRTLVPREIRFCLFCSVL